VGGKGGSNFILLNDIKSVSRLSGNSITFPISLFEINKCFKP
jgi:hypothetical protein